jgi:hypothetical protein
MATLYQVKGRGEQHTKVTGKKIMYWRKTNDLKVDSFGGLSSQ